MPKQIRRSSSVLLNQRSSIKHNFSSDSNMDSKRDSQWWKNLSNVSRRNIQMNPSIVLSTNSTITDGDDSQWWRNLSENDIVPLPNKLNIVEKNKDSPERILSQSESDENEEIFPHKKIFGSQEQRSQKSRYSKAFNLNTEKTIKEDQVHQSEEQNLETKEFKDQLIDEMKITESPTSKVTKGIKKSRKTKSIFTKNLGKRKFSDAFVVTDYRPEESEQKQESTTENIFISEEPVDKNTKESLFKLDRQKKKYSEAFLNASNTESVKNTPKKDVDTETSSKQIHTKIAETSEMPKRVSKVMEKRESSDEEINVEEIQKDTSYVSNRSLNALKEKKTSLHKIIEKTPRKEIYNTRSKSNYKDKKPTKKKLHNKKDDSESEEEIFIEEINTQKEAAEISSQSINVTEEIQKNLFKRNTRRGHYSESFLGPSTSKIDDDSKKFKNVDYEVDDTKLYSSYVKIDQILRKEENTVPDEENIEGIGNQDEVAEKSINITRETKKNLFRTNIKSKKYSEAFLNHAGSEILETDEQEHTEHIDNKSISSVQHAKDSLFTLQNKNRQFSQAFAGDDENKENSRDSTVFVDENAAKQKIENLKKIKISKDSQAFLELISMQKSVEEDRNIVTNTKHIEDKNVSIKEATKEENTNNVLDNDTKFSSIASIDISTEIKHPLFGPKARKSLYSVKSKTKNNENTDIQSDHNPKQNLEKSIIKKINAKRYSLRSTSPTDSIGNFFEASLISSTKLLINPNENKDSGSEGSSKKKGRRSIKSVSAIHENCENVPEFDIQKAEDKNVDSEVVENKEITPKKERKSKSAIIVHEDPNNFLPENEAIDMKNSESKGIAKKKIATSKRGRKSESVTDNRNNQKTDQSENEITKNDEPAKYKKNTPKSGRKSKSSTIVPEVKKNIPENETIGEKDFESDEIVKGKISTSNRGRKSKSVTAVQEDQENDTTRNDEPARYKKIGRISKSATIVSEDKTRYPPENKVIDMKDSESKEIVKKKIATSENEIIRNDESARKRGRKSKSVTAIHEGQENDPSENEITRNNKPAKYKKLTSRRGRKSKLATGPEDQKNDSPENETIDKKYSESEEIVKSKISTSKLGRRSESVNEDQENNTPENDISKDDEQAKYKNFTPKRGRSKSATKVPQYQRNDMSKNEKDSESVEIIKSKISISKRGQKSISVTQVREDKKNNSSENEITKDDEPANNDILPSKRGRKFESVTKAAEDSNIDEIDAQMTQKEIVSKIPTKVKTVTNTFQIQDISKHVADTIMPNEDIDINSDETVKRKILPIDKTRKSKFIRKVENRESNTIEEEINNLDVFDNSRQLSTAMLVNENQRQSSNLEPESISNIITIDSSISRARSSQFSNIQKSNKNIEDWLSKSVINKDNQIKNKRSQAFHTNLDLPPTKMMKTIDGRKRTTPSETSETKKLKNELLFKAVKNMPKKQSESQPLVPPKKITDFFSKLNKNEKLKPIQKNTNIVKKVPKPVCTARLIDGKPYYSKKLFHGKRWCNPRFYKLLQDKMRNEYGDETINESETLMKLIAKSVQVVIKSKKYLKEEVDNLKTNLAKRKIIVHDYDFFCLCENYLPAEYQDLVIPRSQAFETEPTLPYDPENFLKPIEY